MSSPIIVALDGMGFIDAKELAYHLQGKVWGFKFNDSLTRYGIEAIMAFRAFGKVFADYKFHDIPNTVKNHCLALRNVNHLISTPDIVTVHASGGVEMMKAAVGVLGGDRIAAVTVLTSLDADNCNDVYGEFPSDCVLRFARLAKEAGVEYCVCSPLEVQAVKSCGLRPVVPGIRPAGVEADDQKRISTPKAAIGVGAELLVIGRAITKADDPVAACEAILKEIEG